MQSPLRKARETIVDARQTDDEQTTLWNGAAGCAWVDMQELLDGVLKPFEDLLVEALPAGSASRVLDVGCGTGGTTLAVARRLGAEGRYIGIDISDPMIVAARARAEREGTPASFICADAQTHAFEPGSFDMIVSRFGVMFFDDFEAAFANLLRATRPGGRLAFGTWRTRRDNPWAMTAVPIARPHVELPPRPEPGDPGQFAFEDEDFVRGFLERAGWSDIAFERFDADLKIGTTPEDAAGFLVEMGPVAAPLAASTPEIRALVIDELQEALKDHLRADGVFLGSSSWIVTATKR